MLRHLRADVLRRRWVVVGLVLALVAGAGLVTWRLVRDDSSTRFAAAVALAPASTVRFSWTDWRAVRAEVGSEVTASSGVEEVETFLLDAFDRDLTPTSALVDSAPTTHAELGFSPASIDWELFAQGEDGAVVIMGLAESFDVPGLRERLRSVGFEEPEDADGVWRGGVDLLEGLSGPVTPEVAALRIDEDAGVLVGSDDSSYLAAWADDQRGDRDDGVGDVVLAVGEALAASAYTGDYTCAELAMSQAEPADRTRAGELVEAAGEVHPLTAYAIAAQPDGGVRVAMGLETEEQARTDADSRSRLAAGPAPGQGGTFPERFSLDRAAAAGRVVTLDLTPVDGWFVLSDLNQGPVLFATC